ncbi:hypothetical protein KR093_007959 [Drosophila rubida]|uniref:Uncharacterized protein n=1 Tax=Drosophila rubida TaxID=30044 RepID=A0AAD4K0V5_9MUSC|nr:hypothetical protein KR093_007959 [Drosophila rubida]
MLKSVCCMRLPTAGVIVGYLGLAGSILLTIGSACVIGFANEIVNNLEPPKNVDPSSHEEMRMAVVIIGCVYLGGAIISIMASAMLIIGTMKNRHLMMLPWLVLNGLGLFSKSVYNLVLVYAVFQYPAQVAPIFIMSMLSLALYAYIYAGIYSLYKHVQMSNDEQRPLVREEGAHESTTYPNYTKL